MMHPIQEKILALSRQYNLSELGYRKICRLINAKYPQQVKHHLAQLIKKGYLKWDKSENLIGTIKSVSLLRPKFIEIPVYGSANCGVATLIAADKIEGYIKISESMLKNKNVIALKAAGNSLNRANIEGQSIEDGDYVLINTTNKSPHNGDYVLSIIDDCANLKKFVKKNKNQIALISESTENLSPIYISPEDSYLIGGVITQVIKKTD